MSITLIKCFECGKVISGNMNEERKKPPKYEICSKCLGKFEIVKRENEKGVVGNE